MEMVITAAVAFMVFLILQWSWNRKSPAINWPLIGMTPSLVFNMPRIHDYITQLLQQSKGTFLCRGLWFTNMHFFITCDPMNLHHILSKNAANYQKGEGFKKVNEALGDGIFNADAEEWRVQRKILHSIMGNCRFQRYSEEVVKQKVVRGLFPVLDNVSENGIEVDFQDLFSHLTFDNICLLVLGVDPGCLSVDLHEVPLEKAFECILEAAFYRNFMPETLWRLQRWLKLGLEKDRLKALVLIDSFIYQNIAMRRHEMSKLNKSASEDNHFSIITAFFAAGEEHISALENPEKFLRDTAFNLLSAGRDTTSVSLTWFFWHVARNPSVENKILDEMKQVRGENGKEWQFQFHEEEHLEKLVYLHGALCETMRLYSPLPFNRKVAVKSDILPSGHRVRAGTTMAYSLYSVGRMEEIWGRDCLEFKPERWMSEKGGVVHVPSYKFTPFGSGPRTCLGKDLSLITMKIVAMAIIWNYKVECVEGHPISPQNSIVLHMKYGLKVRVTKRHG